MSIGILAPIARSLSLSLSLTDTRTLVGSSIVVIDGSLPMSRCRHSARLRLFLDRPVPAKLHHRPNRFQVPE
jgi:hypothetical protein